MEMDGMMDEGDDQQMYYDEEQMMQMQQGEYEPDILTISLLKYEAPMPLVEAKNKGRFLPKPVTPPTGQPQLTPLPNKPTVVPANDILYSIFPPREADEWVQYVSNEPATRYDVRSLQEQFEMKLMASKARSSGICPVRIAIYAQCFDELIRQVTVDCSERGLLLMRVRDEIRMTTAAYRTLYETSVDFGRKKAVEAEKGKQEMIDTIDSLTAEKDELETQVKRLQAKMRAMEKNVMEQQQADDKKHREELTFLQRTNQRLKQQEETLKNIQRLEREAMMAGS